MNRDTLVTLLKYKRWADAGTLASVKAVDATAHPEKRRLMQRLMNHIYVVDRIFQANLTGQAHGYTALNTPETPDVETLETTMRDCVDGHIAHVSAMNEADFDETIRFRFTDGSHGEMKALDMLNHMLFHGTYHRGAVGWLVAECGGVAFKDVLTIFLRDHA
ncbi:DinB family protein [Cronobacter sakazakii]|uniref:DinB family protein n=1 Tax=Cronobacter sakazakii TaxID=28141 RepID=UPI000CFCC71E|nr:DinB family protein [Cronobacter sakazakii]EIZ9495136.1 DinB family protein [Cronobacter sakazakii]PQY22168.1 diguanylate cyclase [Cronobacter sakazakii]